MGGVSSLSELGSSGREPCFVRTGVRPLLTQFEGSRAWGLNSFRLVPRSPSSFVLCGAPAPNGSFVNHQQLFGSVCKTAGLRIRSLFLAFLVLYLSWSFCSFSWPLRSLFLAFLVLYFSWSFCSLTLAFLFCYGFLAMFWAEIFSNQKYLFFLAFLFPFLGVFGPFPWPFLVPFLLAFFIPLRFLGHVLGRNLSGRKYLSVSPGKREFWGKSEMSV